MFALSVGISADSGGGSSSFFEELKDKIHQLSQDDQTRFGGLLTYLEGLVTRDLRAQVDRDGPDR